MYKMFLYIKYIPRGACPGPSFEVCIVVTFFIPDEFSPLGIRECICLRRRSCSHFMPPLHTSVPHWCHPYQKCLDTPLHLGLNDLSVVACALSVIAILIRPHSRAYLCFLK